MRLMKILVVLYMALLIVGVFFHTAVLTADGGRPGPIPPRLVADGGRPGPIPPRLVVDGGRPGPIPPKKSVAVAA